jgi:RNA polymerase sigma-70 factor, ECF subfamily
MADYLEGYLMLTRTDRAALERELVGLSSSLHGFARSLCKHNPSLADDLVQDTMIKVLENLDKFEIGSNLRAWSFTIMKNHLYSQARKRKREVEDVDGVHTANLAVGAEQEIQLEEAETKRETQALLDTIRDLLIYIPTNQRNAFWLVHAEGRTYQEAADFEGCPIGTIKSRIHRALEKLLLLVRERGLSIDTLDVDNWEAAFSGLSYTVAPGAKRVRTDRPDLVFGNMGFALMETLRLGSGPSTQVFAFEKYVQ